MKSKVALLGAIAGMMVSGTATAAFIGNVSVLGSTDGVNYSSTLSNLSPNTTISYEVVANLIPGTTNGTKVLNAVQTAHPDATTGNYDGFNNLEFNLTAAGGGTFATGSIFTDSGSNGADFTKITGSGIGASTSTSFTDVKTGLAPGFYEGADANHLAVIFTGTFNYTGGTQSIASAYDGQGGFEFNSNPSTGTVSLANKVNVGATDTNAYLSFTPLTLSSATTPEPAVASLLTVGASILLKRRRQTA